MFAIATHMQGFPKVDFVYILTSTIIIYSKINKTFIQLVPSRP